MKTEQEKSNRVVVYGSNTSGAQELATQFQMYLEKTGINSPIVQHERDVALVRETFYGRMTPQDIPSLPRGVIVFPWMRQYDLWTGKGMFIRTFGKEGLEDSLAFERIKELCDQHNVPLIKFEDISTSPTTKEGIRALLLQSPNQD